MKEKYNSNWKDHFHHWESAPTRSGDWDGPSSDLWDKVAENLPLPPPPKHRRGLIWGLLSGLCIGIVLGVGLQQTFLPDLEAFPIPLKGPSAIVEMTTPTETASSSSDEVADATDVKAKTASANTHLISSRQLSTPSKRSDFEQNKSGNTFQSKIKVNDPLKVSLEENKEIDTPALIDTPQTNLSKATTQQLSTDEQTSTTIQDQALDVDHAIANRRGQVNTPTIENVQKALAGKLHSDSLSTQAVTKAAYQAIAQLTTLSPPLFPDIPKSLVDTKIIPVSQPKAIVSSSAPSWTVATYAALPIDQGLQQTSRNWQIQETRRSGWGLSLQRTSAKGWFGSMGLQYETANYTASTRYLRRLNLSTERQDGNQLVSEYEIDASLLKASETPTTVVLERGRDQQLPNNLCIILQVETSVREQNMRIPLYLGHQLALSPNWGLQLQLGAMLNQTSWERRQRSVSTQVPRFNVRSIRFPDQVVRQKEWSAQLAMQAGVYWQLHPNWQLSAHWQRIGTNNAAPQVLQQAEQQLLLSVGYRL